MLRRHSHPLLTLQLLVDLLASALAFALAFVLRFHTGLFGPSQRPIPSGDYLFALPAVLLLGLIAFSLSGRYRSQGPVVAGADLRAAGLATLLTLALSALYRGATYSRIVIALDFFALLAALPLARGAARFLMAQAFERGLSRRRAILVGEPGACEKLKSELPSWSPIEFVACLPSESTTELDAALLEPGVDEVFLALPLGATRPLVALEERLRGRAVDLTVVLDDSRLLRVGAELGALGELPALTLRQRPVFGWNRIAKRLADLVLGALAFVLAMPLLAIVALLVRLSSRGPVIFRQRRVGRGGREFVMFKFRTMSLDAESAGPCMAVPNDPRCTPLGSWLRRLSLDELPQLWNVLRGEMSLVGPRPERPEFIPPLVEKLPHYPLRQTVPAGMTGLAQVHGQRGATAFDRRLRLDLDYVSSWSMLLDLEILVGTLCGGFFDRNPH